MTGRFDDPDMDFGGTPDPFDPCAGERRLAGYRGASAPQEPDDALIENLEWLLGIAAGVVKMGDPNYERAGALYKRLTTEVAQEPVADDDAEWLRSTASLLESLPGIHPERLARMRIIANRLQAKAPETGA